MPNKGDDVLLLSDGIGLSKTSDNAEDPALLYSDSLSRGESAPRSGRSVVLSASGIGQSIPVGAAGDLGITITSTNSPITETETLSVSADVTNSTSQELSGTITLSVGGTQRDNLDVTIAANSTESKVLNWPTDSDDVGDYTAVVESGTDSDSTPITVQDQDSAPSGDLSVSITDTNSPVLAGTTARIKGDISNTSGSEVSGNIALSIDGGFIQNVEITIPDSETYPMDFVWKTSDSDSGDYTAKLKSGTDSDTTTITVEQESYTETVITASASASDRAENAWNWVTVQDISNTRVIEATLSHIQKGEFYANESGVALLVANSKPANDDFIADVRFNVPEGGGFGLTGKIDLGSEKTGTLYLAADDSDSSISPP